MADDVITETLAATGQSVGECHGKDIECVASGTWVGTVNIQKWFAGQWNTVDTFTANGYRVVSSPRMGRWRIDWTRTSGSLVFAMQGGA